MNLHAHDRNHEVAGRTARRRHFACLATLGAILAVVSLSSCTGYTSPAPAITGAVGGDPQAPGTGALSASPTTVAFGSVAVGSTATQSVTVRNTGTATVNISQATVSGAGFTVVGGIPSSTIAAGQSATYQIQYAPTSIGAGTGMITVTSDASNSPLSISLTGTGTQPGMTISPAALNFNNIQVGQSSVQTVTLTNGGTSNLVVTAATISGAGFGMSGLALPKTITAGQSASFTVQFSPTSTIGAVGGIVFTDNAPGSPQTLTMTGSAVASNSTLTPNPGSFNFNGVVVGSTSSQAITLINSGTATVTVNQVSVTGTSFSTTGITAGETIAAGTTATFTAQFAPTSAGVASGTITITTTATNPTVSIPLVGTGTQGVLTSNPASVVFSNVPVGGSGSVSVTLSNSGTAALSISAGSVSGTGFSMTGLTVPQTLTPGQTTSFSVTFAPTSTASASGSVSVTNNTPGTPLIIALSGAGAQAQIAAAPATVSFGNVVIGNSNSQPITLSNHGTAALTFSQVSPTGSGFSLTGLSTTTTIAAGGSAIFNAVFTPVSSTAVTGSIALTTNASPSLFTISLSGTGVAATRVVGANPTSLSFGTVNVNGTSSMTATLTNSGNSNVNISGVTVTGAGFSATGVSNGTVLTPNQSVTLNVTFAPRTGGAVTGASVSIASNATNSPTSIALSGTGQAGASHSVMLSWNASTTSGAGYNIFRATSPGGYGSTPPLNSSPISGLTYTDTTVVTGQTYYYVATAVDLGTSSTDSNEVPVTIP